MTYDEYLKTEDTRRMLNIILRRFDNIEKD